jgi:general secretion pathway protein H
MTLIEIMIVVGLMALLTGTLVLGSGILLGANRRAAATLVVAGVRKGMAHANTTGKPARLRLDLESERIILEEASSRVVLRKSDEQEEEDAAKAENAGDALLADAEALAEAALSGAGSSSPGFQPIDALGQDGDSPGRSLGSGIQFVRVQTEHDEDPVVDGEAYIYFWPGGLTERAIVQITQKGDEEDALTVVISPLTGRAEIQRGFVDLPEDVFEDEGFSEREE